MTDYKCRNCNYEFSRAFPITEADQCPGCGTTGTLTMKIAEAAPAVEEEASTRRRRSRRAGD